MQNACPAEDLREILQSNRAGNVKMGNRIQGNTVIPRRTQNGVNTAIEAYVMNTLFISKTAAKCTQPLNLRRIAFYGGAAILLIGGALPSCATSAGFGRDVEKVGNEIQEAAR